MASVTSVAGVNKGSKVADVLTDAIPDTSAAVGAGRGWLVGYISGNGGLPQNARAALASLWTAGALAFNTRHPEGVPMTACGEGDYQERGVYYFSWSGAQPYTNALDPADPALAMTSLAFSGDKNDGLVSACSSHLGTVIRDDYAMNHLDEINQAIGIVNLFET